MKIQLYHNCITTVSPLYHNVSQLYHNCITIVSQRITINIKKMLHYKEKLYFCTQCKIFII
jgi:hypothetical protein